MRRQLLPIAAVSKWARRGQRSRWKSKGTVDKALGMSEQNSGKLIQVKQSTTEADAVAQASSSEPVLLRDKYGAVDYDSLPDVIQWFLDYDQRVAVIKHAKVEELFQWKQEQSRLAGENVFSFNRAEDRLAICVLQSIAHNPNERELRPLDAYLLH